MTAKQNHTEKPAEIAGGIVSNGTCTNIEKKKNHGKEQDLTMEEKQNIDFEYILALMKPHHKLANSTFSKSSFFNGTDDTKPLPLFKKCATHIGIAYFVQFSKKRTEHSVPAATSQAVNEQPLREGVVADPFEMLPPRCLPAPDGLNLPRDMIEMFKLIPRNCI